MEITNAKKVRQFMEVFEQSLDENIFDGRAATLRLLNLRFRLVKEEFLELCESVESFISWTNSENEAPGARETGMILDFVAIIDALGDLLYVSYGFLSAFGVDADKVFDSVHNSNMSKLDEFGRPIYREDGKVLKGPGYQPPNFDKILEDYMSSIKR